MVYKVLKSTDKYLDWSAFD